MIFSNMTPPKDNIIIRRVIISHRGPMYMETPNYYQKKKITKKYKYKPTMYAIP